MNISRTHDIVTLSNKKEIISVFKEGQKIYNKFGLLFLYKNNNNKLNKVGIFIKKKSGNAVKRNAIKRLIRQLIIDKYTAFSKYEKIIFIYKFIGEVSYKELCDTYLKNLKNYESNITYNN